MKILFSIIITGTLAYLLLKLCLYFYRPFFLSKTFREIEKIYNRLLIAADKELASAVEDFKKWQSGDKVLRTLRTENEMMERINTANKIKAHEEEVHGKFFRLRERFIQDHSKLSESIVAYQRYLEVRLRQRQDAALFANAVTSGTMTFDEMAVASEQTMLVLEKNERKLDVLLS